MNMVSQSVHLCAGSDLDQSNIWGALLMVRTYDPKIIMLLSSLQLVLLPPRRYSAFFLVWYHSTEPFFPRLPPKRVVFPTCFGKASRNCWFGPRNTGATLNILRLSSKPEHIFKLPDSSCQFILRTDASNHGLGAVLLQYVQGYPHPVTYTSRNLLDRERRYSTIKKECLAIRFRIQHFDYYLKGKEFILEVDHKLMVYLSQFKDVNDRLLRWVLKFQDYRYRVVHFASKDNIGADFLSRY